jgi:acyl carrier protein
MPSTNDTYVALVELIKEVKPGLEGQAVEPDQSVVEDLGLDSLDLLQLSRKIRRSLGADFSLDEWNESAAEHGRSVGSILAVVEAAAAV